MTGGRLFLAVKILVTFCFLYVVFANYVDYENFASLFGRINYPLISLLVVTSLVPRIFTAHQIQVCLRHFEARRGLFEIFKAQLVATFYSFIVPGDLVAGAVTWHLLSRDGTNRVEVAGVLTYLRILNLITLIPFAIVGVLSQPRLSTSDMGNYVFAVCILLSIGVVPFLWRPATVLLDRFSNSVFLLFRMERLSILVSKVLKSLQALQQLPPGFFVLIVSLSLLVQVSSIAMFWIAVRAVDIQVPFAGCLWLLPLFVLIHSLPITIAGTGLREWSLVFFLGTLYNVASEKSLMLSLLLVLLSIGAGLWGGLVNLMDDRKTAATVK